MWRWPVPKNEDIRNVMMVILAMIIIVAVVSSLVFKDAQRQRPARRGHTNGSTWNAHSGNLDHHVVHSISAIHLCRPTAFLGTCSGIAQ